jgi:hypothetical protein
MYPGENDTEIDGTPATWIAPSSTSITTCQENS